MDEIPSPSELMRLLGQVVRRGARARDLVVHANEGGRAFVDVICPAPAHPDLDYSQRALLAEKLDGSFLEAKFAAADVHFFRCVLALDEIGEKPPSATARWDEAGRRRYGLTSDSQQRRRSWRDHQLWRLAFALHEWLRTERDQQPSARITPMSAPNPAPDVEPFFTLATRAADVHDFRQEPTNRLAQGGRTNGEQIAPAELGSKLVL
jgi:hypothetical protein